MIRLLTFILLLFLFACSSPAPDSGEKSPQDPKELFRGRWKLHAIERQVPTGEFEVPERNAGRQGFIIYDGLGGMGVQHVPAGYAGYPLKRSIPRDSLSRQDLMFLATQFVYFGRYTVDTTENIITHHIETDLRPFMWGETVQRRYEFRRDTLILMPLTADPPMRITWIRVNDKGHD